MKLRWLAGWCFLISFELNAGNLIGWDSSFETGSARIRGGISVTDPVRGKVLRLCDSYNHCPILYGVIQKDKEYVFGFRARAAQPVKLGVEIAHVKYGRVCPASEVELDPQWREYSVAIPKQTQNHDIYFVFRLPPGATAEIDDLMLSEGASPAPWAPAHPFTVGINATGYPGNIVQTGDPLPPLRISVYGYLPGAFQGKLAVKTFDFEGKTVNEAVYPVRWDGRSEAQSFEYPLLLQLRGGYYIVQAVLTDGTGSVAGQDMMPVAVVPPPSAIAADASFFGIHPAGDRVSDAALPRIGVKWVRYMPTWDYLEHSPGVYDLRTNELKKWQEFGLNVYFSLRLAGHMPKEYVGEDGRIRDWQSLRKLIAAVAPAVPANVRAWEIENEPDQNYPSVLKSDRTVAAGYYGEVVANAARYFKEITPQIPVAAMSVSGGAGDASFIEQTNRNCAADYDIASPHPYTGSRFVGPGLKTVLPESYLRKHLMDRQKYVKGKRFLAGEVGYAYDIRPPLTDVSLRNFSNYVARSLILIKSVPGVEKVMWFKAQGCYERDFFQYGLWRDEYEPLAATVFYANIAAMLDGALPTEPIFESDLRIYSFRRPDGSLVFAIWRYQGNLHELALECPADQISAADLFGNPVKLETKDGKVMVPVGETPLWVFGSDALTEVFKKVKVDQIPLQVAFFADDGKQLSGVMRNCLPVGQSVKIESSGATGRDIRLDSGVVKSFVLRYLSRPEGVLPVVFRSDAGELKTVYDRAEYTVCPQLGDGQPLRIKLDQRKYIYPPDPGIAWQSAVDLSVECSLAYDLQYFYFDAAVTDPVHVSSSAKFRKWNADSIQFSFDTLNDGQEGAFEYNDNDVEFIAWLDDAGPHLEKTWSPTNDIGVAVKDAKVEIVRDGTVTHYRIALPWKALVTLSPNSGRMFRFNFIVNQNNGTGRHYWIGLSEGIGEMKYPFVYPKFILK